MVEPIERAARAFAADLGEQDLGTPYVLGDDLTLPYLDQGEVDFSRLARAVLMAIREPSEAMLDAYWALCRDVHFPEPPPPNEAWQAMIDASLAQ